MTIFNELYSSQYDHLYAQPGHAPGKAQLAQRLGLDPHRVPQHAGRAVGTRQHGFHGDASIAPWDVVASDATSVAARWRDREGLVAARQIELSSAAILATTDVVNTGSEPLPLILVEHLILGGPLAGEDVVIELDGGSVAPQTWAGEPDGEPAPWPAAFGTLAGRPLARFGVVRDLATRAAVVRGGGRTLTLAFSHPHLWLWQEGHASTAAPWDGRTACLGIEPATCPSADGLARAIARGEATILAPGDTITTHLEIEIA